MPTILQGGESEGKSGKFSGCDSVQGLNYELECRLQLLTSTDDPLHTEKENYDAFPPTTKKPFLIHCIVGGFCVIATHNKAAGRQRKGGWVA